MFCDKNILNKMKTSNLTPTKKLLVKMLTENTGKHFLDSGGDNGRAWQRNQGKNFEAEPRVTADFWDSESNPQIIVSTYHYLAEVLTLDAFCNKVNKYFARTTKDAHWVQECAEIIEDKFDTHDLRFDSLVNTYNGENNLSQILLFQTFKHDGDIYALLQIHGGADVRGGYTDCKCFKLTDYLTGNVDVSGYSESLELSVDNRYNGYSLTDESGNDVEIKEADGWEFDFNVYGEGVYMYQ